MLPLRYRITDGRDGFLGFARTPPEPFFGIERRAFDPTAAFFPCGTWLGPVRVESCLHCSKRID